jgi:group I intron endonuclease
MNGIIYIVENKINNKVYIGQTIQKLSERWSRHCKQSGLSKSELNMNIKRAILKYGKDNFSIRTLEICNRNDLNDREIYWIEKHNSYIDGYNSNRGGNLSKICELKIDKSEHPNIVELYKSKFSLRSIAAEYNVDKKTISSIIDRLNVEKNTRRAYKYSSEFLKEIKALLDSGVSGKELSEKYNISKSYLSQIKNERRRI